MANNLGDSVTKFTTRLDRVIEQGTVTGDLNLNQDLLGELSGNGKIEVAKIAMDGLADHTRGGGFVEGGASLTWETMQLQFERDREFTVDVMEDEERERLISANLMGEFARTQVVPEVDAIRFCRLHENAGNVAEQTFIGTYDPANPSASVGTSIVDAVDLAEEAMQDAGLSLSQCIIYMPSRIKSMLKRAQPWRIGQGEAPNANFDTYDDMRIRVVPQSRFYTAINLLDGKSAGEEQGGFEPAYNYTFSPTSDSMWVPGKTYYSNEGGTYAPIDPTQPPYDAYSGPTSSETLYERIIDNSTAGAAANATRPINFMVLSPQAAAAITKHEKLRYFSPDVNQKDDAHLWQYRLYHDLLVYENKRAMIYSNIAGPNA